MTDLLGASLTLCTHVHVHAHTAPLLHCTCEPRGGCVAESVAGGLC